MERCNGYETELIDDEHEMFIFPKVDGGLSLSDLDARIRSLI